MNCRFIFGIYIIKKKLLTERSFQGLSFRSVGSFFSSANLSRIFLYDKFYSDFLVILSPLLYFYIFQSFNYFALFNTRVLSGSITSLSPPYSASNPSGTGTATADFP